jgi:hypothetical protein
VSEIVVDLRQLSIAIEDSDRALSGAIKALLDAHSAKTDLCLADDQIRLLASSLDQVFEADAGSIAQSSGMALLASAIVLYARSMKTSSDHRKTFDWSSHFSDQEKCDHDFICQLRNDAIAHFGPGPVSRGFPWHQDGAFAYWNASKGSLQVFTASKRKVAERDAVARIQRQIHRAVIIVGVDIKERNQAVSLGISDAVNAGRLNPLTLQNCACDLDDFFGDKNATGLIDSGERFGHKIGVAHHALSPP